MDVTPDKHWESALALIAQSVSQQQFDTWFKPIVFESFNNDTKLLVLRVPSSYVYEYIEEHYIDLLSRVLFSAFANIVKKIGIGKLQNDFEIYKSLKVCTLLDKCH